jgi:Poly(R)-hydroxyalkanoic acid synthase subunit (PHA_synth_III_E)
MTSLWRQAFDTIERPAAAAAESCVQSKTFMDLAAVAVRAQRRLTADGQRMTEQWLHAWGMPARGDVVRLMNQVASLERHVRELERDQQRHDRPPASRPKPAAKPPAGRPKPAARSQRKKPDA